MFQKSRSRWEREIWGPAYCAQSCWKIIRAELYMQIQPRVHFKHSHLSTVRFINPTHSLHTAHMYSTWGSVKQSALNVHGGDSWISVHVLLKWFQMHFQTRWLVYAVIVDKMGNFTYRMQSQWATSQKQVTVFASESEIHDWQKIWHFQQNQAGFIQYIFESLLFSVCVCI